MRKWDFLGRLCTSALKSLKIDFDICEKCPREGNIGEMRGKSEKVGEPVEEVGGGDPHSSVRASWFAFMEGIGDMLPGLEVLRLREGPLRTSCPVCEGESVFRTDCP